MNKATKIILSLIFCLIILFLAVGIGSAHISPSDTFQILSAKLTGSTLPETIKKSTVSILLNIRIPRLLMAFLCGAALSLSGTVMQSVLRNPLASSYTLGVSSGASLFAAFVIVTGFSALGSFTLPFFGFLGGILTVFTAILLSLRFDKNMENQTIILTGMVLSLFVNAILTLVTALAQDQFKTLIFWQMGSFSGQNYQNVLLLTILLIAGLFSLQFFSTDMDIMTFGEEQALSVGVDTKKVKLLLISISALLTGACVSFVGVIGFVDLIAPHIVRKIFGSKHKYVLPMSALFGGAFMVLSDLLSRTLLSPRELPVGAVTALLGAPFFAYVYFKRRKGSKV